jgi:8-oxo-dGTP diphosphatase
MSFSYQHPRPALTVDCVVFGLGQETEELRVLLVQRALEPFQGRWALPGGFVRLDEGLEQAARRELEEEAGIRPAYLEQLYTFGEPDRDPRERVVSVAYVALVRMAQHPPRPATDARDAAWFAVSDPPLLAFDHQEILGLALERLRAKVRYQPVGFDLLPARFTLSQLQRLYETILEQPFDKRNFRKRIIGSGLLEELDEVEREVAHRAARLYRFDRRRYEQLRKKGFSFDL